MPEVTITYNKLETLKILKGLAKYFDFKVKSKKSDGAKSNDLTSTPERKAYKLNGVTVIPGDPSVDISEMEQVFSGRNLDAKELREKAWRRTK